MKDKINILAKTIVNHSIKVQEGENVKILVETMEPLDLVKELVKLINEKGANVDVTINDPFLESLINSATTDKKIELLRKKEKFDIDNFDMYFL